MRHVELIISHMADLLLCGYTAEDVGVCLGHSDEEGDVVAVSSVRHLRLLSGKLQLQHKVTETNILLYYILCNVIVIENDIFLKLITIKNYPK